MRITVRELRELVAEAVKASPGYMKKERVRELLQQVILDAVKAGDIKTQADLEDMFKTLNMSINALKMVPVEVYGKLAGNLKQ